MYTSQDYEYGATEASIRQGYQYLGVFLITHALYFSNSGGRTKKSQYLRKKTFILHSKLFSMIADTISKDQDNFDNDTFRKNLLLVLETNYANPSINAKFNNKVRNIKGYTQVIKLISDYI